jgi:ATP-dependent Lhr-like helicase
MQTVAPILEVMARWSAIPKADDFLIERVTTEEGHHLFFYPFEGRLVHEGLAALFAHRLTRKHKATFSVACNDYGFELLADRPLGLTQFDVWELVDSDRLAEDIVGSLNAVEMARRQFREIARIAGLVFQGYPGMHKSAKQVQASSGLFFDVFSRYDRGNLLLQQAEREVLERQLEQSRLARTLVRLQSSRIVITDPPRPTPMAFPILVDRLRETVTSETLGDRIERMSLLFEQSADS